MPKFDDDLVQLILPKMNQGSLPVHGFLGNIDTVSHASDDGLWHRSSMSAEYPGAE